MRITAELLQENYPKFIGFEGEKESLVSFISDYYEMSECKKIELVKNNEPHLTEVKATLVNGTVLTEQVRRLQKWAYIEAGTL